MTCYSWCKNHWKKLSCCEIPSELDKQSVKSLATTLSWIKQCFSIHSGSSGWTPSSAIWHLWFLEVSQTSGEFMVDTNQSHLCPKVNYWSSYKLWCATNKQPGEMLGWCTFGIDHPLPGFWKRLPAKTARRDCCMRLWQGKMLAKCLPNGLLCEFKDKFKSDKPQDFT